MTEKKVTINLGELDIKAEDIQKIIDKKTQGKWKPYDEKYVNDRFMVTHTGYLVDTKTEIVYLTVQAFLNFVNNDLLNAQHKEIKYYEDLLGDYLDIQEENEQLKKNKFICLDCEHSGYVEIGCLCEYNDHWQEHINECENFKELRE